MKVAFVRTKAESTVFLQEHAPRNGLSDASLQEMKMTPKAGSSSKNIILGLHARGVIHAYEEWKFWSGPFSERTVGGDWPVKLFSCNGSLTSENLEQYIAAQGQPDILWVEGPDCPPYLQQILQLCPDSFKLVYSKDWRPWKIKRLDAYNLVLVDEISQANKIKKSYPNVHCGVWDKLIDYENTHYPIATEKIYDLCYIAYLRERKNHELLFHAMAKLEDRSLTCVCIGADRNGRQAELEKMAVDLHLNVIFAGEVSKEEVNRYVNQSKIGVMCAVRDAAPRAILEYMAANVPVLVNAELLAGTRYVVPGTGIVCPPDEFHLGMRELFETYNTCAPRERYLEHFSASRAIAKFIEILTHAGLEFDRVLA